MGRNWSIVRCGVHFRFPAVVPLPRAGSYALLTRPTKSRVVLVLICNSRVLYALRIDVSCHSFRKLASGRCNNISSLRALSLPRLSRSVSTQQSQPSSLALPVWVWKSVCRGNRTYALLEKENPFRTGKSTNNAQWSQKGENEPNKYPL